MPRCRPVVSSLTLLNHRLLAAMHPESSRSKSVINGREEYRHLLYSKTILAQPEFSHLHQIIERQYAADTQHRNSDL